MQQTRHYHTFKPLPGLEHTPLRLHAAYQLREILTAVGRWTEDSGPEFREGVLRLHDQKTELIFITLDKSEARHEGVAYHDYAISRDRFHWQTQNSAGPSTEAGKRYLEQKTNGWQFQLFVRTQKGAPYRAIGPAQVLSSQGGKPISITLELGSELPVRLFEGLSCCGRLKSWRVRIEQSDCPGGDGLPRAIDREHYPPRLSFTSSASQDLMSD